MAEQDFTGSVKNIEKEVKEGLSESEMRKIPREFHKGNESCLQPIGVFFASFFYPLKGLLFFLNLKNALCSVFILDILLVGLVVTLTLICSGGCAFGMLYGGLWKGVVEAQYGFYDADVAGIVLSLIGSVVIGGAMFLLVLSMGVDLLAKPILKRLCDAVECIMKDVEVKVSSVCSRGSGSCCKNFLWGIVTNLLNSGVLALIETVLLVMSIVMLVPVMGPTLYVLLKLFCIGFQNGLLSFGIVLFSHFGNSFKVLKWCLSNSLVVAGYGLGQVFLLMIPGLNVVATPILPFVNVCGTTLLFFHLEHAPTISVPQHQTTTTTTTFTVRVPSTTQNVVYSLPLQQQHGDQIVPTPGGSVVFYSSGNQMNANFAPAQFVQQRQHHSPYYQGPSAIQEPSLLASADNEAEDAEELEK